MDFEDALKQLKYKVEKKHGQGGRVDYHFRKYTLQLTDPLNPDLTPALEIKQNFSLTFGNSSESSSDVFISPRDDCTLNYRTSSKEQDSTKGRFQPSWYVDYNKRFIFTKIRGSQDPRHLRISPLEE